ncbi:MAG: nitrate reductase [Desulfovibrionaceae bacterium]|nr:nitrate reductase [Desulfovibrionaceae bacterium]
MKLEEAMRQEVGRVFLNPEEFGEEITLNGRRIVAVADDRGISFSEDADHRPGVTFENVTLCVAADEAPGDWLPGTQVSYNNECWHVLSAPEAGGMRIISLYRERA